MDGQMFEYEEMKDPWYSQRPGKPDYRYSLAMKLGVLDFEGCGLLAAPS